MKTISPTYLFLQTLYEAVTSHFPATLDFFRPQHSFRPQNTLAHPQDHPKKVHLLPKFLERFLTRSLLIWIFFLVSIQPRGLFLSCCHLHFFNDAVGTATKTKKHLSLISVHKCPGGNPYDAPPPSSSSWLFYLWYRWDVCPSTISMTVILAKGAQETANIWKNDSAIRTPSVPNYIECSIYLFNLVWLRFAFNILQPLHLLFWFHEDNVCLLTRQTRLVCAGSWPMHSPQQPASRRPQAPYTLYTHHYPSN